LRALPPRGGLGLEMVPKAKGGCGVHIFFTWGVGAGSGLPRERAPSCERSRAGITLLAQWLAYRARAEIARTKAISLASCRLVGRLIFG